MKLLVIDLNGNIVAVLSVYVIVWGFKPTSYTNSN